MIKIEETFNNNHMDYAEVRPGYPKEMYKIISQYKEFNSKSQLLDIGAGHGVATDEVYSLWSPQITAIEPGAELYNIGAQRFKGYSSIEFIHTTFEEFNTDKQFDGIYAATAFHWLDAKTKFERVERLLQRDGLFFPFWNYYAIKNSEDFLNIQEIYKEFHPNGSGSRDVRDLMREKITKRRLEIESSCLKLVEHRELEYTLTYSAERYIKLLKTFPNNSFDKSIISPFYSEMEKFILSKGDKLELNIIVVIDIAKRSIS